MSSFTVLLLYLRVFVCFRLSPDTLWAATFIVRRTTL
jgi:hypothetical protein